MRTTKKIDFSNAAYSSFISLTPREQSKADKLIRFAATNLNDPMLLNIINKLAIPEKNFFSIKLSPKLRIVIEVKEDEIKVADILNMDLAIKYSRAKV